MSWQFVRLVAGREIRIRIRSKAYVIATLVLMAAVVAIVVVAALVNDDDRRTLHVAVVDGSPALRGALVANGDALDTDVHVVNYENEAAAEDAVRDDDVDVALSGTTVIWEQEPNDVDEAIVKGAMQSAAIAERAEAVGLEQDELAELLQPVEFEDRFLEPRDSDRAVRIATASIGVILLFIAIQTYGNMVLMGVVEEKSSRVVEVLLNHLRPRHLLAGKVLGIGALGLLQLTLVLVSALVAMASVRGVDVPDIPVDGLIWFVVWFLLGFGLYATAFAMGGSLVSRQEDAASIVTPITIPFIASYIASFVIASSPDTTFATVLSLIPITAPMIMPVRIAAGNPSALEVTLSVAFTIAAIYVLVVVAGRVYAHNVLRTGGRVSWRSALATVRTAEGS